MNTHASRKKGLITLAASLATLIASGRAVGQTVLYVNAAATGTNSGTNWADAYRNPQAALAAAELIASTNTPVQIWVAASTYMPDGGRTPVGGMHVNGTGSRTATFQLLNNVALYGGFAGTETSLSQRDFRAHVTILSGDLNGNDGPDFTNTGDNAYRVINAGSSVASAALDGFTITGADGVQGCGLNIDSASPTVANCIFLHNRAVGGGAGVLNVNGTPTFLNCRFLGNAAEFGAGLYTIYGDISVVNCEFSGNSSTNLGGAVHASNDSVQPRGSSTFTNCTFSRNHTDNSGGAMLAAHTSVLNNCIFWDNTAAGSGSAVYVFDNRAHVTLNHCSEPNGSIINGGSLTFNQCGPFDPLFVNPVGPDGIVGTIDDDLRLSAGSSCIDRGNNMLVPAEVTLDLLGHTRFIDDPCQPDMGDGTAPQVDLGAIERISAGASARIYVKTTATGSGDGSTWTNACTNFDSALLAASLETCGTEIWVAAGTYRPGVRVDISDPRSATFQMTRGVSLFGGFAGTETSLSQRDFRAHVTILSGDLNGNDGPDFTNTGDNAYRVINAGSSVASAALDGFTITGADGVQGCGLNIDSASPTVANCIFLHNRAVGGGAGVLNVNGTPTFLNCRFLGNAAEFGAGLYTIYGDISVVNCEFSGNSSTNLGGAVHASNDSVQPRGSSTFTNCTFSRNHTDNSGGAMLAAHTSVLNNCIFWDNTAAGSGSAVYVFDNRAHVTLNHCSEPNGSIINGGSLTFNQCGPFDPLFVNPVGPDGIVGTIDDDLRLQDYSPCIDRGISSVLPLDVYDINSNGVITEVFPVDILGNPRQIDDSFVVNTGTGPSPIVDLGAHESGFDRFFVPSTNPVVVVRGSAAVFSVFLAANPGMSLPVTVQRITDDPDVEVAVGSNLVFSAFNYSTPQQIVISAGTSSPFLSGAAQLQISAPGYTPVTLTVRKLDPNIPPILYVSAEAAPGGNGLAWSSAYHGLAEALLAAKASNNFFNQIWVAQGTYTPTSRSDPLDPRSVTFSLVSGVSAYGGFAGTETSLSQRDFRAHVTILSGDLNGNDGPDFTNTGDNAYRVINAGSSVASAALDGFTITGADGVQGCGLNIDSASPTVANCIFLHNRAVGGGAGVLNVNGTPTFLNCRFLGNAAEFGAGLYTIYGDISVVNCEFSGNSSTNLGGAVHASNDSVQPRGSSTFTNCTFSRNHTDNSGGAMLAAHTSVLNNCIFWDNTAAGSGSAVYVFDNRAHVTLNHCSEPNGSIINGGSLTFNQCGPFDPLFVNPVGPDGIVGTIDDDLRLSAGSSCIDRGDSAALPMAVDIVGNGRRVDDPMVSDLGAGPGPFPDLGAYEFGSQPIGSRMYVSASANATQLGTSWADACNSPLYALNSALAAAGKINEIWIAGGSYSPDGGFTPSAGFPRTAGSLDRGSTFRLLSGAAVYGGFAGAESSLVQRDLSNPANITVLSGDLNDNDMPGPINRADNSYQIVSAGGTDSSAILDGFTIMGGNANGSSPLDSGAGLYLSAGRPTLRNIRIIDDSASTEGGGLWCDFSRPQIDHLTIDTNAGPVGSGGVISRSGVTLQGPLTLTGGTALVPITLDLRSSQFDGPGGIVLGSNTVLRVSSAPFYDPVIFRTPVTIVPESGTPARIQIDAGQRLLLDGGAIVDLSGQLPGSGCQDSSMSPLWGTILVNGELVVRQATVQNTNVAVTLAGLENGTSIINNDIRLVQSSAGYGGQFFVAAGATVRCNVVTSEGDRYLDFDPDPSAAMRATVLENKFYVLIKQGVAGNQGELLELRSRDFDNAVNAGQSGAMLLAASAGDASNGGYHDTWVLERLEVQPNAKVTLTNRQGFDFRVNPLPAEPPEALYVKDLVLNDNAILNTGLQRLYYQQLLQRVPMPPLPPDQWPLVPLARDPQNPNAPMVNGARIVDSPLLGFSLINIAMDDDTEFGVRVRTRLRDPADSQPQPPAATLEGSVTREASPMPGHLGDHAMHMQTHADGHASASSIAAKGAFARAGDENVTITFKYLFCPTNPNAQLLVYLSDDANPRDPTIPIAGDPHHLHVATINPPSAGAPGGIGGAGFATFELTADRGALNFHRGAYIELELRGQDACVWIDDFDPDVRCNNTICGDFDFNYFVDGVDLLYLLADLGKTASNATSGDAANCLDKIGRDGYIDLSDFLNVDSRRGGVFLNVCQGRVNATQGQGSAVGLPPNHLIIAGKAAADQQDRLYVVTSQGMAAATPPLAPPSMPMAAGNAQGFYGDGRLIQDASGSAYQLHAVQGLIRVSDALPVLVPAEKTGIVSGLQTVTVRVGIAAGLPSSANTLPLLDAAFGGSPDVVYVVPVVVVPPSGETRRYKAGAKLQLHGDGTFDVLALYGVDPCGLECANTSPCSASTCNLQGLREIEVDGTGNVIIASGAASNINDWLLVYDAATGNERFRTNITSMTVGGPAVSIRSPSAMTLSADGNSLYVASGLANAVDGPDLNNTRLHRFSVQRNGVAIGSLNYAGAITLAGMRQIDAISLHTSVGGTPPAGSLLVVGHALPPYDPASNIYDPAAHFSATEAVFTLPRFTTVTPDVPWTLPPNPPGSVAAAPLVCFDLALPLSAIFVGGAATTSCTCPPCGDINHDGVVNAADVPAFVSGLLGGFGNDLCKADFNHDATADGDDLQAFVNELIP